MRTLLWKELRENIVWAVLVMLALGGAEIYVLHHLRYFELVELNFNDGVTLCKRPFLIVTMFGCAMAGLALGLLQVLPDLKRDRWAALLHRPLPRGRFFWGKALAGVLLYFLAAGAPFLFCVWQAATPGHFNAPFVPAMACPALADLVTGLSYYFAALVIGLQGGSVLLRGLPFFAALHASFFALHEKLFRVAVESSLAMSLALCLAGWGAIHLRESLGGRPWLGRIAFLIVAFYGACGFGDLLETTGELAGRMGILKFSVWEVLDNGVPVREDYVDEVLVSATDSTGQSFADPKYHPDRVRGHLLGMNVATSYVGDPHGWRRPRYQSFYRESNHLLYAYQPYSHPRLEQWFHIYDNPRCIGVLPVEKRVFAQLGADGFASPDSKVQPFSESDIVDQTGGDILVIATPQSLRFAHLATQQVVPVALPAAAPIYGMCHTWASIANGSVDFKGVAFGKAMAVYDVNAQLVALLPYHQDVDRWGSISLGVLSTMDRFILRYEPSMWMDWKTRKSMTNYVEMMDSKGNVLASYTLPPPPLHENPPLRSTFVADRLRTPTFFFGEMLYRRLGAALGSSRLRAALEKQLGPDWPNTWLSGEALMLVALVLSIVTFFWARRAQLPPRTVWAWTLGVFALGLPGLLMFWLAGERPRTVTCPSCSRRRRIDAAQCGHCGASWPARPPDDTLIIDGTSTPLPAGAA